MNLLERRSSSGGVEQLTLVWLLGVGLIGSAVRSVLLRSFGFTASPLTYDWNGTSAQNEREADEIRQRLLTSARDFSAKYPASRVNIKILWVAGRAGFSAREEDIAPELAHYRRALTRAANLSHALADTRISFHLVSSGGGVFEGQRCVDRASQARPLRPYGHLKWTQEQLLLAECAPLSRYIYRPSSVYGEIFGGHRLGLIPAMVLSAVRQNAITISGSLSTLRDYVSAADVGAFLARELVVPVPCASDAPVFLASGRACSIQAIRHIVERVTRRKTLIVFDARPSNVGDNTYTPHVLPPAPWSPVDIETGVRRIYAEWCKRGQGIGP